MKKPWQRTATLLRENTRKAGVQRIGLEIERIGLWENGTPFTYYSQPKQGLPGAQELLPRLAQKLGWEVLTFGETEPLGLHGPAGKVSLEPGSQLEFAANPAQSLGEAALAINSFEEAVDEITSQWGLRWIGLGLHPTASSEAVGLIPLTRYRIMDDYLSQRGKLARTMMRLTTSVQINFDYSSESDAIEMLQVALALAPLSYALFGNSAIGPKGPTGWLSFRSEVWRHTDASRSGLVPEAFEPGFDFERYAELAWKRPLMFAQDRAGHNVASQNRSVLDIAEGKLADCELSSENELNSLRQVFTEARLKPGYLEVRSIDGLRVADRYAAVAFWTGVMYSPHARRRALERFGRFSADQRLALWDLAGREGLKGSFDGSSFQREAKDLLKLAAESLKQRGLGEEAFLTPLEENIEEGKNPARRVLDLFMGTWKKDVSELIRYSALRST